MSDGVAETLAPGQIFIFILGSDLRSELVSQRGVGARAGTRPLPLLSCVIQRIIVVRFGEASLF